MWMVMPVAVGWLSVTVVMAMAEATSPQGSVIGALVTLWLYGFMPLGLVLYLMTSLSRAKVRRAAAAAATASEPLDSSPQADHGGHAAGPPVAPEREVA